MKLNEILDACNMDEVLRYTKILVELEEVNLPPEVIDVGVNTMIQDFWSAPNSYILSSKFKLFISADPLGPVWALENKDFTGIESPKMGILGKCNVDNFKFFNILLVPWSDLKSMECDFCSELNGQFLEYIIPFMLYDISALGFQEVYGEEVDEKVNNLLGI